MDRQYLAARAMGIPEQVVLRVTSHIRAERLASAFPLLKIEKKATRRGEFYLFLCIGTDEMVNKAKSILRAVGCTPIDVVPEDEIRRMVARAEIGTYGTNALTYRPRPSSELEDPYYIPDSQADGCRSSPDAYNRLLYWLSATGQGSWASFSHACVELQLGSADVHGLSSIYRNMRLLGHLECSEDGAKWTIVPPTEVTPSSEGGVCFISGARTPSFLDWVSGRTNVTSITQKAGGPDLVRLQRSVSSPDTVQQAGRVAETMLGLLPNPRSLMETLGDAGRPDSTRFAVEVWDEGMYVPCQLRERNGRYIAESGLYRLSQDRHRFTLYFDSDSQRWLKGDWYTLRFLSEYTMGVRYDAVCNDSTSRLFLPKQSRLPLIYERPLVLSSGLLPVSVSGGSWLCYEDVSPELVLLLASLLQIRLRRQLLDV